MKYLYNYPSLLSTEIENNNTNSLKQFNVLANHYTCVSDYDYTDGSFRGEIYKDIIQVITNIDCSQLLRPNDNKIIYEKLDYFIKKTEEPYRLQKYKEKYKFYSNYPINICEYYKNIDNNNVKYTLSLYELFFLRILFKVYSKNNLFLIPKIK